MRKAALLTMFGLSTFLIVRAWYQQGNSGIPTPSVLSKPAYAFGLLMLLSDWLGNVAVVVGGMATVGLLWQAQSIASRSGPPATKTKKPGVNPKVTNTPTNQQPTKKPGVNP